jgi:uncharacterized protein YukE
MKTHRSVLAFTVLTLITAAGAIGAGDILQQLGVSLSDARQEIVSAFGSGEVGYSRVKSALKSAAPAVRATMAEQVLTWTKAYVSSPQFATDYAAFRDEQKPKAEKQVSVDEQLRQNKAKREAALAELKKNIASMPAEYRKSAEDAYQQAAEQMKQMETPEALETERQSIEATRQDHKAEFDQAVQSWSEQYPAAPNGLVKRRLHEFLDQTAGVDFNAKLAGTTFVNPDYEAKPSNWKLAFRAGRETTERARTFAERWLAELK